MTHLTPAQLTTLNTSITADPALNALPASPDNAAAIANAYNAAAAGPNNVCWKTVVSNEEIGDAMSGTEIAGLSALNMQRAQMLSNYSNGTQNPSRADRRAAFDAVFSGAGGAITRAALAILWKRTMTRVEKLYATGTGSTASPATLVVEGSIDYHDVNLAMGWPE